MNGDTMAGDSEAAAAILGMVEQYGTKEPEGARAWTTYVFPSSGEQSGVAYSITEYCVLASLPGNIAVLRHTLRDGPYGDPFLHQGGSKLHRVKESALIEVAERLLDRREALTSQINTLRAEIRRLTAGVDLVVPHVEDVA